MNVLISLTVLGVLAMFGGILRLRKVLMPLLVLGLIVVAVLNISDWNTNAHVFNDMMVYDNFAIAFSSVCLLATLFTVLFFYYFHGEHGHHLPEVFSILIFSLAGCMVLVSFNNMLLLFLGLEILSLSLYVLAGLNKRDLMSNEASMKYFLMGSFSTGFMLLGIALLYGASGSFYLTEIAHHIQIQASHPDPLVIAGVVAIMVGLLFKVAVFPLQFWAPDVYQGAPTIITAYMATAGKVAAFAALLRLVEYTLLPAKTAYADLIWILAVCTMLGGNIVAIYQQSVKRMLAYSSIAHAGYMLIALLGADSLAINAILFYSVAYTLATIAAFMVVMIVQEQKGSDAVGSFDGLSKSNPWLALVLAISMLSLTGIPPLVGFFGKFYIFSSAISGGWIWLVVLAVFSSFISAFYYFRPMIAAYMHQERQGGVSSTPAVTALLVLLGLLTVLTGIFPAVLSGIL